MNNIISMCLWGDKPMYLQGMIENCKLWKEIYPDWGLRLYIDESIDINFAKNIHSYGVDVRMISGKNKRGPFYGTYWRLFVNDDPTVDRFIIRDADSRFNYREQQAVNQWIESGKDMHIMRDHPHHKYVIQAGMCGMKTKVIPNVTDLINKYARYDYFGCDQDFLSTIIFPYFRKSYLAHDEIFEKNPFPPHKKLKYGSFVGEKFDENNIHVGADK